MYERNSRSLVAYNRIKQLQRRISLVGIFDAVTNCSSNSFPIEISHDDDPTAYAAAVHASSACRRCKRSSFLLILTPFLQRKAVTIVWGSNPYRCMHMHLMYRGQLRNTIYELLELAQPHNMQLGPNGNLGGEEE